jgi:hypothetical protein
MSTQIFYNNSQILSGQATPLVSKRESVIRYGERWANKTVLELHGKITGCGFAALISGQNKLIEQFSTDFQSFQIKEGNSYILDKPFCLVKSINFNPSEYHGPIDYSVSLDCYEQNLFTGVYGILEPVDQWQFEESLNGVVTAIHTVSANGFNTSSGASNAFSNALNFVNSKTGINPNIQPYFISCPSGINFCLKNKSEKVDRLGGNYGITEKYVGDKYYGLDGVLRYTTDYSCNEQGIVQISIAGTVEGCGLIADINAMRNRYNLFNPYDAALEAYQNSSNASDLNTFYTSSGISEDLFSKKLTFNISFDNRPISQTYLDYSMNLETAENGVSTVAFNGTIKSRAPIGQRWTNVSNYYSGFDVFSYITSGYADLGGQYTINPTPASSGATFNKFLGEIGVNSTWTDKDVPINGFGDLNYTLNFVPSFKKVAAIPLAMLCDKPYYVADLNYNTRSEFTIQGNGITACGFKPTDLIDDVRYLGNSLFSQYCPKTRPVLEENSIKSGYNNLDFRFGWSAEGTPINSGYDKVGSLNLS